MKRPQTLIEFNDQGTFTLALQIGRCGPRIALLTEDGRRMQIRSDDLLLSAEVHPDEAAGVEGLFARVETLQATLRDALPALWDAAQAAKGTSCATADLLALLPTLSLPPFEASPDPALHRFVFERVLRDEPLYFRYREGAWQIAPRDEVEQRLLARRLREERAAAREDFLALAVDALEGRAAWTPAPRPPLDVHGPPSAGGPPAAAERFAPWVERLVDLAIRADRSSMRAEAMELLEAVGARSALHLPRGAEGAFSLLVALGILHPDENFGLRREGIRFRFPDAVEARARERAALSLPARPGVARIDDRPVFSIDAPDTRDFDDAFSVRALPGGGWEVGVHITWPGETLQAGELLDVEACRRGTSIYLAEGVIPMLPSALGLETLALRAGTMRRTLTLWVQVDAQGIPGGQRLTLCDVRVTHNLTYAQARALLEAPGAMAAHIRGAPDPGPAGETDATLSSAQALDALRLPLEVLSDAASHMRAAREATGALTLDLPEIQWRLDEDASLRLQRFEADDPARLLVSEWMVRFNRACGERAMREEIPLIYRGHEAPSLPPAAERWLQDPDRFLVGMRLLRHMRSATASLRPERHSGLGIDCYAQATSPLRRYADLVAHLNLGALLLGEEPPLDAPQVARRLEQSESATATAAQVTRENSSYWALRWLEARQDEPLEAMVIETNTDSRGRVRVVLCETLLQSTLSTRRSLNPGERIEVLVENVQPRAGRFTLRLA